MKKHLLFSALALLLGVGSAVAVGVPYTADFSSSANVTILTGAEGTRTWGISSGKASFWQGSSSGEADAWLILQPIDFEAGFEYSLSFQVQSKDPKDLYITIGNDVTIESQTKEIWHETISGVTSLSDRKAVFTVDADGSYCIGFHCYGQTSWNDIYLDNVKIDKYVVRPGAVTDPVATAGEKGALEVTLSWTNPAVNDGGAALDAISGVKIYRNTYSSFTPSESNLIATVTEGIAVGQPSTWTDRTLTSSGKYYYAIVPFNDNGDSPIAPVKFQSDYAGEDTSIRSLTNVVATAVEGDDKAVSLTWDLPTGGNGGYVNPANVSYKIMRQGSLKTAWVTLESAWKGELPYVDTTIPGLDSYTYKVYYIYNGSTDSSGKASNAVLTGGAMGLPYSENFYKTTSFNYYSALTGAAGTATWKYNSSGYAYFVQTSGTNDAWLMTPPFDFEAGKAYAITFKTWRATNDRELLLSIGTAPEIAAQTNELWNATVSATSSSNATPTTVNVSVQADGRYYFGFHCTGAAKSGNICLDDISVKEIEIVPLAATDFTATAAAEGALKVDLKWTNPTADNIGNELSVIPTVAVYRGETLVKRFANSAAGAEMTWSDENVDAAGIYTYKIVPYIGSNAGEAVEAATEWVGPDVPAAPTNATAVTNADGNIDIAFEAPVAGANGGYVDFGAIRYTVVRHPDGHVVAENVAETSCVDTDVPTALGKYYYEVTAAVGSDISAAAVTNALIIGGELDLPYNPDFSDQSTFDLWSFSKNKNDKTWVWKNSQLVANFTSDVHAYTPPFKAKKGEITVNFNAECYNYNNKESLQVGLFRTNIPDDVSVGEVQIAAVESSWGTDFSFVFSVPDDGVYYVGYYLEECNWECVITKSDIEQTMVIAPLELPYIPAEADVPYEGWSFPGSTDANPWGYDSAEGAVKGSAADMWFFTPCFNAAYGYYTVTYQSTAPVIAAVYTVADKNADPVGLAAYNKNDIFAKLAPTVGAVATYSIAGEAATAKVPNYDNKPGLNPYYIGFHVENADGAEQSFKLIRLEQHPDDVTGVEDVVVSDGEAVYYDLQGNRVVNPEKGRIYIRIAGSRSEKIIK